jgi:hypothetical protein
MVYREMAVDRSWQDTEPAIEKHHQDDDEKDKENELDARTDLSFP